MKFHKIIFNNCSKNNLKLINSLKTRVSCVMYSSKFDYGKLLGKRGYGIKY